MSVVITVQHPAHVHFFKHVRDKLIERGIETTVFARQKEIVTDLLKEYNIEHEVLVGSASGFVGLAKMQLRYEYELLKRVRRLDPDYLLAIGGTAIAHVSEVTDATAIIFTDGDYMNYRKRLTFPFADVICTPDGYRRDLGSKQIRYAGYHELAYLHPNLFEPDAAVLRKHGIDPTEPYSVLRFVSWEAHHDYGKVGFDQRTKLELAQRLDEHGSVFITSESPLPEEFEEYRLSLPPQHIHQLLYHADLYVGDSQTMATEAALLGTPAVRSNSFATDGDISSNFVELEETYDLLFSTNDPDEAVETSLKLASNPESKDTWREKRRELLSEKIDVTRFVVNLVTE